MLVVAAGMLFTVRLRLRMRLLGLRLLAWLGTRLRRLRMKLRTWRLLRLRLLAWLRTRLRRLGMKLRTWRLLGLRLRI